MLEFFKGIKKLWISVFNSVTCALSDSTISMTTTARLTLNCSVKSTGMLDTLLFVTFSPKIIQIFYVTLIYTLNNCIFMYYLEIYILEHNLMETNQFYL